MTSASYMIRGNSVRIRLLTSETIIESMIRKAIRPLSRRR
jgi:hypothetical protein